MSKSEKPPRLKRISNWGLSRIRNDASREASQRALGKGFEAARETLHPTIVDRKDVIDGFSGRYEDGGRQRFAELFRSFGLSKADLDRLAREHRSHARVNLVIAISLIALSAVMAFHGWGGLTAIIMMLFALVFAVMSLRHDFSAWQIDRRSFSGFRLYLAARTGRIKGS